MARGELFRGPLMEHRIDEVAPGATQGRSLPIAHQPLRLLQGDPSPQGPAEKIQPSMDPPMSHEGKTALRFVEGEPRALRDATHRECREEKLALHGLSDENDDAGRHRTETAQEPRPSCDGP